VQWHFYARQQNASRVLAIVEVSLCPSVRLSVRPSVTLRYYVKKVQARITKFSHWTAPRTLVFRDKILCPWVRGSSRTKAPKRDTPSKRHYSASIGSCSVKTIADRYIHAAYHNKYWSHKFINIDDLERS